jgi:hypothetical protein
MNIIKSIGIILIPLWSTDNKFTLSIRKLTKNIVLPGNIRDPLVHEWHA